MCVRIFNKFQNFEFFTFFRGSFDAGILEGIEIRLGKCRIGNEWNFLHLDISK